MRVFLSSLFTALFNDTRSDRPSHHYYGAFRGRLGILGCRFPRLLRALRVHTPRGEERFAVVAQDFIDRDTAPSRLGILPIGRFAPLPQFAEARTCGGLPRSSDRSALVTLFASETKCLTSRQSQGRDWGLFGRISSERNPAVIRAAWLIFDVRQDTKFYA
jgi:hypothetical protein